MRANEFRGPVNIGSDQMISINKLADMVIRISGKDLFVRNIPGPEESAVVIQITRLSFQS